MSVIEKIRNGSDEDRKVALELFVHSYRQPLFNFLVKCKKVPEQEAEDLVQDFLIHKVLSGKILNHDDGKGRFRNLLRVAIHRDFLNQVQKKNRERIDAHQDLEELNPTDARVEDFIDQAWTIAVFSSALIRLKAECIYWGLFFDRVLTQPPLPYDRIIEKHGIESPEKASNFLMTAKRAFNRILAECIREQSSWTNESSEEEFAEEIDVLRSSLQNPVLLLEAVNSIEDKRFQPFNSLALSVAPTGSYQLRFIEESSEANWEASDWQGLLNHLICQPLGDLIETDLKLTLGDFLTADLPDASSRELARMIKDAFSQRARSGKSPLPQRIDVVVTFVATASYVVLGGNIGEITSMTASELANRLQLLTEKDWIPDPMASLIVRARDIVAHDVS